MEIHQFSHSQLGILKVSLSPGISTYYFLFINYIFFVLFIPIFGLIKLFNSLYQEIFMKFLSDFLQVMYRAEEKKNSVCIARSV